MPGVEIAVRPYEAPANLPDSTGAHLPEWNPGVSAATEEADTGSHLPEWQPKEDTTSDINVSGGEAITHGLFKGAALGAGPAFEGLAAAAGPEWNESQAAHDLAPIIGAAKMLHSHFAGNESDEVRKNYERGRKKAQEFEEAASEQHPLGYFLSQLGGALAVPVPGIAAASAGGRLLRGALTGGAVSGAAGAGEAISEGENVPGIAGRAGMGAAIGGVLGGTLGGVLGPRLPNLVPSAGERAAATAEKLGAPLPRGLASDYAGVRNATAKLQQVPIVGGQITKRVEAAKEAAGGQIGDIASTMAPAGNRAGADVILKPGLQAVIDKNHDTIDAAYDGVRAAIDRNAHYTMPRTEQVLNEIMAARKAAHWEDPAAGLGQFRRAAGGSTFEGAQRARVDARNAGNPTAQHPGFNKGDYNKLTRAMGVDLRDMAYTSGGNKALKAFDEADKQFGHLSEQNDRLAALLDAKGEGATATLLGAAKEKGGDTRLLAQLKASMRPDDFAQIGGTLLHELGKSGNDFSLAQFVTNWNKVSDGAKRVLFQPQHLRDIEDIVGMGAHIKKALTQETKSHSANLLILLDVAKDVALLTADIASGGLGVGTGIGATTTTGIGLLTHWLAQPAKAASMSAWSKAYRGLSQSRSPIRIAAFNLATKNLANNLGIPARNILAKAAGNNEEPQ
jgi:hypothetical protein